MTPYELYEKVMETSNEFFERNDCAVKALAIATGEGYEMAHYALECQGRKPRDGTFIWQTLDALESLGYTWERIDATQIPARTGLTLNRLLTEKPGAFPDRYIVSYSRHLGAVAGSEVLDWSKNRRKRIVCMYKISRKA